DPQQPAPDFGPLPQADDCTTPVYACATHAITLEPAALIHHSTCTAPDTQDLPGCNCTPEPALVPDPVPHPEGRPDALPPEWTTRG
ncbi:hypothetical protein AB0435_34170, partial [Streptomyces sp. NPDC051173]